jgi:hypothetical protein
MLMRTAFSAKEELAMAVKEQLLEVMTGYGYQILSTLVTDLEPDSRVKNVSLPTRKLACDQSTRQ